MSKEPTQVLTFLYYMFWFIIAGLAILLVVQVVTDPPPGRHPNPTHTNTR